MPRRTLIIFIASFLGVGILIYGGYFVYQKLNPSTTTTNQTGGNTGYGEFNPFGTGGTNTNNQNTGDNTDTTDGEVTATGGETIDGTLINSKFTKLTDFPVAGATFFYDTRALPQIEGEKVDPKAPKTELVPSLRYVERITGHIYERFLDTGIVGKISNSTIPNIYESFFDGKAQTIIYRYLSSDKSIASFVATLGGAQGSFLPSDAIDVSLSPDKTKYFYLVKTPSGVTGTIASFIDGKKNQFFSSSFSEWLSQWVVNGSIFLTTKASGQENGYIYTVNTTNGSMRKVFGGVLGLTTLVNPSGTHILYSTSVGGRPALGIFDIVKNKAIDLGLAGLPEKCTWFDIVTVYCAIPDEIQTAQYPDSWYQGLVSFSDHFVKITLDTTGVANTQKIDGSSGTRVDGTHLFLDDKATTLFFTNKKDSTLWSLNLK
jgi:hypothetical protein